MFSLCAILSEVAPTSFPTVDVVLNRLSFSLSHFEVVVQRCLAFLFRGVRVAVLPERLDDVVHGEVCEVSLPELRLGGLLRLSRASSLVKAMPKAKFRLVLVLCLPQSHVGPRINGLLIDLAKESWDVIIFVVRRESTAPRILNSFQSVYVKYVSYCVLVTLVVYAQTAVVV